MADEIFDERVDPLLRKELGCKPDDKILGYVQFAVSEKDGKLDIGTSGGGFWPHEMKKHMNDTLIMLLRDAYKAVLLDKKKKPGFLDGMYEQFDFKI